MKLKWSFTILLGIVYLALFQLWMHLSPAAIRVTGLAAVAVLTALMICAARRRFFVNLWDALFHAAVILDILLEAVLIERHDHSGFYLCAAAFAAVLVGYRWWWLRAPIGAGTSSSR